MLIIGEVIQAVSRQVTVAVNLQKDKITGSEPKHVFRASLFTLIQQIYYTLEKVQE